MAKLDPDSQAVLDAIVEKEPAALSTDDIAFLQARSSYLTDKQKATYSKELKAKIEPVEPEPDPRELNLTQLKNKAKGLGLAYKGLSKEQLEQDIATVEGPAGAAEADQRAFAAEEEKE